MKLRLPFLGFAALACLAGSTQIFQSGTYFYNVVDAAGAKVEIQRPISGNKYTKYTNISGTLPEAVTYNGTTYTVVGVGERAMQEATLSSDLIIPDSYTYLADWAFREVSGNSVTIGAGLVNLGLGTFSCNKLKEFKCSANNPLLTVLTSGDDSNSAGVLVSKDKTVLAFFPGGKGTSSWWGGSQAISRYTVPSFITEIGDYAFQKHENLRNITFHNGMTRIGNYAFYECLELTSISIPYGCQLGKGSFGACEFNLTSVTLGGGQTEIPDYCFFDSDALRSITLPEGLESIGDYAFNYSGINSVKFPSTLKSIGYNSFSYAPNLTSVTVNDALEYVGERAFGMLAITSIDLKNVKYLGDFAFQSCSSLASVSMNHVERIGKAAFFGCEALTTLSLPESLTTLDGLTFFNCSKLPELVIPSSTSSIGLGIAVGTYALPEIQVEESNEFYTAVDGCLYDKALTELLAVPCGKPDSVLTVPATVQTIGEQAVRYARVKSVVTGNNLKYIAANAFATNPVLEEVTLGARLDSIKEQAFLSCPAIIKVTSLNPVPPYGGVFDEDVYNAATLFVPRGSKAAYQADANWSKFLNIEEIEVVQPGEPGDVNGDNAVDIDDINLIINIILDVVNNGDVAGDADVNGDGTIDVEDINALINMILAQ
ncbi:MAG: leucine-rich repeat protein [Muribaculaceae bacterium]|nr:leucine-rich repeat protein [Muribaculaceae bacterium]